MLENDYGGSHSLLLHILGCGGALPEEEAALQKTLKAQ